MRKSASTRRRAARRRRRRRLGRRRPRDPGPRPRHDRRPHLDDRRRRLHARRRDRLADAQARARLRQPRRRRRRHRRRPARPRRARARTPSSSGGSAAAAATSAIVTSVRARAASRSARWCYAGPIFYPAETTSPSCAASAAWAADADEDVTGLVVLTTAPPLPVIPEEWHGRGSRSSSPPRPDRSRRARGTSALPRPRRADRGPARADALPGDPDARRPALGQGDQRLLQGEEPLALDDRLIDGLAARHAAVPGPQCEIHVHQMGGAVARVPSGRLRSPSGRCRSS